MNTSVEFWIAIGVIAWAILGVVVYFRSQRKGDDSGKS